MITVRFKKIKSHAVVPSYAHPTDAGMDLYSSEDYVVPAGKHILVSTGIIMALPVGYEGQVRPKSGLALKNGITVLNTPGTLDADYRGELGVILMNHSSVDFAVKRGMKVAQLVLKKFETAELVEDNNLDAVETKRGSGGFGSTGLH